MIICEPTISVAKICGLGNSSKILVCPLNWGLGHASRCVPVIRYLLAQGKEVIIASDGYPLQLLKAEFPGLTFIHFPSYTIRYGKGKSQVFSILKSLPNIVRGIYKEHKQLKQLIAEYQIDTVLSDNRFGLWNKHIKSIYMTHQLMVKMPRYFKFLEPFVWRLHRFIINKYDVCLIPDKQEDGGFAGDLTHKYPLPRNAYFTGILSRFSSTKDIPEPTDRFQVICVLSGVEPQRTILENKLIEILKDKPFTSLIVQGLPTAEGQYITRTGQVKIVSSLPAIELQQYLYHTPQIICRSGYSSVMDLLTLGKTALLIPTPGQTEQEYLAIYLATKGLFTYLSQEGLTIKTMIDKILC